ncbi:hypothetical protein LCI18_011966 [Fusarium solani-melongenae]|uniref:Uncharacterized protein n=1 Tax=Fusarium solani subsp. cucurbitae TaxID=2747967 RepID=A0ACD3ZJK1_FUSSC|nr:hypothetical protein LCI18_011966 [Fusarium solani-melongenae]
MSVNNTESFEPSYDTCKAVSAQCPVSATLYGDYFTTGACIFFALSFAALLLMQIYYTFKSRAWSYAVYLGIGTGFELLGYFCRKLLSDNPWQFMPFVLQLFMLMLAPTFVAAAIAVTFKHLVIHYGVEWSVIKPRWYPWLFVGSDVVCIIIQAAGCAFAAMSSSGDKNDAKMSDISSALLILGVVFQVVNMVVCGGLMLLYYRRRAKACASYDYGSIRPTSPDFLSSKRRFMGYDRVRVFVWAISAAYVAIIVRCIYRIPEMATGWGSDLMKDEITFLIFDGAMILLAVAFITVFHPANFFPQINKRGMEQIKGEDAIPLR